MSAFASVEEMIKLWRPMSNEEKQRAALLLNNISDRLRVYAQLAGVDIDAKAQCNPAYYSTLASVVIDVAVRTMNIPSDEVPMSQMSQSALGYTVSGTYLVPGGGIFIKNSELSLLGLRRQRMGVCDYDFDKRRDCNSL